MLPGHRHRWMSCLAACVLVLAPRNAFCTRPMGELESFALHDLVLVATIKRQHQWVGCFRLPDQSLRLVDPGTYVGKDDGKVTAVERGHVHVTELVSDGQGGWIERPRDLQAPASTDHSILSACRAATRADDAARKRWEAEEAAKKIQYAAVSRSVRAALLGWRWTTAQAPVVSVPEASSWKAVAEVWHYGDGFLLVTRGDVGDYATAPWHSGVYYLASPTAAIQRVAIKDCQMLEDVVVSDGTAYWLCFHLEDKWSLVATKPGGERSVSELNLHADRLRLGLGASGVLAISADTVYRQQGPDWKAIFHSPVATRSDGLFDGPFGTAKKSSSFLPLRDATPFEHDGMLYFPTVDSGNNTRLFRMALRDGASFEEAQDFLGSHYFGDWGLTVHAAVVDARQTLWIATEPSGLFGISATGKVRMGSTWGDVAFPGPLLPDKQPDDPKDGYALPAEAVMSEGNALYLADDKALVAVRGGKVTPLARFESRTGDCCHCGCGLDPALLERFADGTFIFAQRYGGLYLLKKKGASYEFEAPLVAQEYIEY